MVQCRELLRGFEYECIKGSTDVEVSEVVKDSREITKDCLLYAYRAQILMGTQRRQRQ